MADFPDWRVESPEDSAFKWLCEGQYMKAILSFESWILRTKHTWTDDKEKKLGDLYRGLAEAYWHVHCPDDALEQILRCVWENCHEFSEVTLNDTQFCPAVQQKTESSVLLLFHQTVEVW